MSDDKTETKPKTKGGMMKMLLIAGGAVVLSGGGAAAGLYLTGSMGGGEHAAADAGPRLIPKSEEKRASASEGGEEGAHGGEDASASQSGLKTPLGEGGDKYASTYFTMDKEFTSNLLDSVHYIQVGIAVSTPYDERVVENLKTHEIAVRSAVLMALGETDEDQVFTAEGKRQLQKRLARAINDTLKQKEGFGGISNVYFTNFVVQ